MHAKFLIWAGVGKGRCTFSNRMRYTYRSIRAFAHHHCKCLGFRLRKDSSVVRCCLCSYYKEYAAYTTVSVNFLIYLQLYLWQLARFTLTAHTRAPTEMSGILCVRSAVDYFSSGCFHCEKPFASPLTGDAFIPAGFRDASCPPSQGNRMPALLFPCRLPPGLAGGAVLETKPKLFLSFLWHSRGSANSRRIPLPGRWWLRQPSGPTQDTLGGVAVGSQVAGRSGGGTAPAER